MKQNFLKCAALMVMCLLALPIFAADAPTTAATAPTWPVAQVKAIFSPTYNADCGFGEWGSGTLLTQDEYGKKYVTGDLGYFGLEFVGINCINMEKLHLDVWIANDATIRVVPIYGGTEYGVTVSLKGQQWNSIDLEKTEGDFAKITDWSNVYQIKIDNASNLTFWLGNVYFYRTTPIEDTEIPTNVTAVMDAASYFSVNLKVSADDNSGAVNFTIYNGETEVAKGAGAAQTDVIVTVTGLNADTEYSFSVVASDENNNKAEAITVAAKTLATPAPAPVPQHNADAVFSIYSDAYTTTVYRAFGWWGATTVETEGLMAENDHALLYTTASYLGWELNNNTTIGDLTNYPYLHMDIYVEEAGSIQFTPIWGTEALKQYSLTAGWNSLDILVAADFVGCNMKNIYQLKWAEMPQTCFIDNVYFYTIENTALNNVTNATKVEKILKDGQVVIIRNGVGYNTLGQIVIK